MLSGEWESCRRVVGEFTCRLITGLKANNQIQAYYNGTIGTCLSEIEIVRYAAGKMIYYWYISDLKIYDEPKNLSGFQMANTYKGKWEKDGTRSKKITRPPQSWCYVEEI